MYFIYMSILLTVVYSENAQDHSFSYTDEISLLDDLHLLKSNRNDNTTLRKRPNEIIGGEIVVNIQQYPFMAFLLLEEPTKIHFCGATILNKKYLLTAAHCVRGCLPKYIKPTVEMLSIYIGGISIKLSLVHAKVANYIYHHKYYCEKNAKGSLETMNHDIALVELKRKLRFSSKISPVTLPPPSTTRLTTRLPSNSCKVLGFGKISKHFRSGLLKVAQVRIIFNRAGLPMCNGSPKIYTEDEMHKNNACTGDSGGPLLCNGKQVGVLSFTDCEAKNSSYLSGFTRVSYYVDWIKANIGASTKRRPS